MDEYVCEVVTEHELCGDVHHYVRRERVTRCRDCEFYEGGGCTLLDFSATDMDLGFCKWAVPRDKE